MDSAADGSLRTHRAKLSTSPTDRSCNLSQPAATSPLPTHTAKLEWSSDVTSSRSFFLTLPGCFLAPTALDVGVSVIDSFGESIRVVSNPFTSSCRELRTFGARISPLSPFSPRTNCYVELRRQLPTFKLGKFFYLDSNCPIVIDDEAPDGCDRALRR
jgi:hypothetical protein